MPRVEREQIDLIIWVIIDFNKHMNEWMLCIITDNIQLK